MSRETSPKASTLDPIGEHTKEQSPRDPSRGDPARAVAIVHPQFAELEPFQPIELGGKGVRGGRRRPEPLPGWSCGRIPRPTRPVCEAREDAVSRRRALPAFARQDIAALAQASQRRPGRVRQPTGRNRKFLDAGPFRAQKQRDHSSEFAAGPGCIGPRQHIFQRPVDILALGIAGAAACFRGLTRDLVVLARGVASSDGSLGLSPFWCRRLFRWYRR